MAICLPTNIITMQILMSVKLTMEDVTRHVLTLLGPLNVPVEQDTYSLWIISAVMVGVKVYAQ